MAKLNASGSQLVYSTYFGGSVGEFGSAIAVDALGNTYFAGVTSSPDMPKVTPIQSFYGGSLADAFVAKFNPAGSQLVYSTYLGGNGNDGVTGIAIDASGAAHLTGVTFSSNFPVANAVQQQYGGGAFDAFATKVNPAGTALTYSTYLGGTDDDRGYRVKADNAGNAYIAGSTESANFPTADAIQPTLNGIVDAFVTKLSPTGSIEYSTYLGGSGLDGATGLAVEPSGRVHLTGFTSSTDFPSVRAVQSSNGGGAFDSFITKIISGGGAIDYSTYLGGSGDDSAFDIAIDTTGGAFVFGRTASTNFPTIAPIQNSNQGGAFDTFVARVSDAGAGAGFESDVSPRTTGDGPVIASDVVQMRRFATGLDTPAAAPNEFQRADAAPRSSFGDGVINSSDVIQARRYATSLDPRTPSGGAAAMASVLPQSVLDARLFGPTLEIGRPASDDASVRVPVSLNSGGNVTAASFTFEFDAGLLQLESVTIGDSVAGDAVMTVNSRSSRDGRVAVLIDSTSALCTSDRCDIVVLRFRRTQAATGEAKIRFTDSLAARSLSDANGNVLPAIYNDGIVVFRRK